MDQRLMILSSFGTSELIAELWRRKDFRIKALRRRYRPSPPLINRDIAISEGITVKELSEKLDVKANLLVKKLVDRGIFATVNQALDVKLATDLSREFGVRAIVQDNNVEA